MNCVVTAGPTFEPLDSVRRLTNFSTGKLGSELTNFLVEHGHSVILLKSTGSTFQAPSKAQRMIPFSTTADLTDQLRSLAGDSIEVVFHAAAVSDFTFGKVWTKLESGELKEVEAGKISSLLTPLMAELVPTPKIIGMLRGWFPRSVLVGWKYETDGGPAYIVARAQQQILENETDLCVMNGPAYGTGFGVLTKAGDCAHLPTANALFEHLAKVTAL